jgi:hypothetical protein
MLEVAVIQFKTGISHLLYKILEIRIYKTVDLCVYEMWFMTEGFVTYITNVLKQNSEGNIWT